MTNNEIMRVCIATLRQYKQREQGQRAEGMPLRMGAGSASAMSEAATRDKISAHIFHC